MKKSFLAAVAAIILSGCSSQPQMVIKDNPSEFVLAETVDILDFEFVQGYYVEFGQVDGFPAYVNKHGGAAVVGSLSGNHISSHIILKDGKACASTWMGILCSNYKPTVTE